MKYLRFNNVPEQCHIKKNEMIRRKAVNTPLLYRVYTSTSVWNIYSVSQALFSISVQIGFGRASQEIPFRCQISIILFRQQTVEIFFFFFFIKLGYASRCQFIATFSHC